MSNNRQHDTNLDALLTGRRAKRRERVAALLTFYRDHPEAGPSDACRSLGLSRQTIYTYLSELERAESIARNDGRVTVLQSSTKEGGM